MFVMMAFSVSAVVWATVVCGVVGLLIGILLGLASSVFEVKVDERESQIRACLPGNNCGGCGYPGCDGCAHAIFIGEARVDQCPVGGAKVGAKIAEVMGVKMEVKEEAEPNKAMVHSKAELEAAAKAAGTDPAKNFCVGCGMCEKNCGFDAIHVLGERPNRFANVDIEKCMGCGMCASKCPKKAIEIVPMSQAKAHLDELASLQS